MSATRYVNEADILAQLRAAGLVVQEPLEIDHSRSTRCRVEGEDSEKRGWHWLHELITDDGAFIVGSYGVFHGADPGTQKLELSKRCDGCGAEMSIRAKECPSCKSTKSTRREFTDEQKAALRARQKADQAQAEAQAKERADRAAAWAAAVWANAAPCPSGGHPYLAAKGLTAELDVRIHRGNEGIILAQAETWHYQALGEMAGALVIPMRDEKGALRALQFILDPKANKELIARKGRNKEHWPPGAQKKGLYAMIGAPGAAQIILEAEGYATAASLHMATGYPAACAIDAGNLQTVAEILKRKHPHAKLLPCGDDDHFAKCKNPDCGEFGPVDDGACPACGTLYKHGNGGKLAASQAALLAHGVYALPKFPERNKKTTTDFNDLHRIQGIGEVRAQVEAAIVQAGWANPPPAAGPLSRGGGGSGTPPRPGAVSQLSLDGLVERFVYVDDETGELVLDTWTRRLCKTKKMLSLCPPGVRMEDIKNHPQWLARAIYLENIGFDPGDEDETVEFNLYDPEKMGTIPKPGGCENLKELILFMCMGQQEGGGARAEALADWLTKWLAYPLQHPGAKMDTALVVHGPQGTGKSLLFEAVMKVYGEYGYLITQEALEDKFNSDWVSRKLFIIADEIAARDELYHIKNRLKTLITGGHVRVNVKNVTAYRERNHMNFVFLSNELQPLVLEGDDRRFFVLWTPPKLEETYYDLITEELDGGGVEAFHDYLLNYPLGDFNPHSKPPMTEAKKDLIDMSMSSEHRFVKEWIAGDTEFPLCPCGSSDLYKAYQLWCKAQGVRYVLELNKFAPAITKRHGWQSGFQSRYDNPNYLGQPKRQRMISPSEADMDAYVKAGGADYRKRPDEKLTIYYTDCYYRFNEALSNA
jgi:putative DNA primase/helicase